MKTFNIKSLLLLVAASLAMTLAAFGQQDTGSITGTVKDPNGAVVQGATVTVKNERTGFTRTVTADNDGVFTITALPPAEYILSVTAPNFKETSSRVNVSVGGSVTYDPQLGIAATGVVVDVPAGTGGLAEINTTDQQQSNVVTQRQMTSLPTLDRNPYALVRTSGNVSTNDPSGRGAGVAINGQRGASTDILLDGAENAATFTQTVSQTIPQDAVSEFRIITGNFAAEYGRASGGVVNVATRSGTNRFEGSIFEQNRNSRFASNGFDNNANGLAKQKFNRNQFGGTVSGPIAKNRWFFLDSLEFTRVKSTGNVLVYVPSQSYINASAANTKAFFATYGTLAATATGGTAVAPSCTACTFNLVSYTAPIDSGGGTPQHTWNNVARVDWQKSNRTTMFFSYKAYKETDPLGSVASSPYKGYNEGAQTFNQNFQISGTHTFTSNLLFDGKFTFRRANSKYPVENAPNTPTLYFSDARNPTINGRCIAAPGYLPCSPGAGLNGPELEKLYDVKPNVTWLRGNHNIRFGGQYVHLNDLVGFGAYQNASEGLSQADPTGQGATNFLAGQLVRFQVAVDPQGGFPGSSVTLPVKAPNFFRTNLYNEGAIYAQDSWRVTRNFTFVPGVRWEYYGPQHSKENLDSNFYFGSGSNIFQQIRNGRADKASNHGGLWKRQMGWAPRLGFAWDITGNGKNSLRGGYGISYERNFGNVTFNVIQNPPFYAVLADLATAATPIPVTNNNFGPLAGSSGTRTLPRVSLRAVDPNIKLAYAHQYGLSFEHQIDRSTIFKIDFSGSAGRRLYSISNINRAGTGPVYLGSNAISGVDCPASTTTTSSNRLNCNYSNINFRGSDGVSNYYGFTPAIESNNLFGTGAIVTLRYTYSVAKDDLSSTFSESGNNFNLGYLDPFNPRLDYGYADFDTRHRLVGSVVYPFGWKFDNHLANDAFGGWTFSTVFSVESGAPFTIFDTTNCSAACARIDGGGQITRNGATQIQTPGAANTFNFLVITNSPTPSVNPLTNNNNTGPFDNAMTARNSFRGPGYWNADVSLFKNFSLGSERYKLQIRGDAFNVFNHANAFLYGGTAAVDSGSGTVNTYKSGRRNMQFSAKFFF